MARGLVRFVFRITTFLAVLHLQPHAHASALAPRLRRFGIARAAMSSQPADAAGKSSDAMPLAVTVVPPTQPFYNEPFVRMPGLRQRPGRWARSVASLLLMVALWSWPWVLGWGRTALVRSSAGAVLQHVQFARLSEQILVLQEMSTRLVVAAGCGAVLGLERNSADRAAGLRSMTLVSVGSALYTLAVMFGIHSGDPARAAAQVCTGVGFIGAGVIAKGASVRDPVRGVTTACAVWVSAALGVVAASGLWLFAMYSCGVSVSVLRVSRWYNAFLKSGEVIMTAQTSSAVGRFDEAEASD